MSIRRTSERFQMKICGCYRQSPIKLALAFENTKLNVAIQESQEALQTRKLIERAKSLLQRQANLSEEEAYKKPLQQQSMRTRRSMREIAEAVILSSEIQT